MFYRYFEILLFFYGLDYPYRFILVIFCIVFSTKLILMLALVVRGLKGVSAFFQTIHLLILCPLILALLNHFR